MPDLPDPARVAEVECVAARSRRGLATALMAALGKWAAGRGGHSCLLQVVAGNAPAPALNDRLGFSGHHRYHYRLAPV